MSLLQWPMGILANRRATHAAMERSPALINTRLAAFRVATQ